MTRKNWPAGAGSMIDTHSGALYNQPVAGGTRKRAGGTGENRMRFGKRKQPEAGYDETEKTPVIRCSICTGEQVAGFLRKENGTFEEVMLIRGEEDLLSFRETYGIRGEIRKIY